MRPTTSSSCSSDRLSGRSKVTHRRSCLLHHGLSWWSWMRWPPEEQTSTTLTAVRSPVPGPGCGTPSAGAGDDADVAAVLLRIVRHCRRRTRTRAAARRTPRAHGRKRPGAAGSPAARARRRPPRPPWCRAPWRRSPAASAARRRGRRRRGLRSSRRSSVIARGCRAARRRRPGSARPAAPRAARRRLRSRWSSHRADASRLTSTIVSASPSWLWPEQDVAHAHAVVEAEDPAERRAAHVGVHHDHVLAGAGERHGQVGDGGRGALGVRGACEHDHLHAPAQRRGQVQLEDAERLGGRHLRAALRREQHHRVLAQRARPGRDARQERQPQPAADLVGRADAGVEQILQEGQDDAQDQPEDEADGRVSRRLAAASGWPTARRGSRAEGRRCAAWRSSCDRAVSRRLRLREVVSFSSGDAARVGDVLRDLAL